MLYTQSEKTRAGANVELLSLVEGMGMKWRSLTAVLSVALLIGVAAAHADELRAPWERQCKGFQTPRQYVVESTIFCLRHATTKHCHERASKRFQDCRFSGDYKKMSGKVQAKMLVVLALSGGASWRKGESM